MTELAELLHRAAPDEAELAEANFDVGIIGARVRHRHRRRVGVRAAVLAGLVLAIIMSVSAVRAHSGARQVDVEGGSHVTTSSAVSRTTIARGSYPALPGPGSVVPSRWLVSLDASNPGFEVGLVSPGWACVGCNDQTGWQVALATSRDGGVTWRIAGQPLPVRTTQVLPTDHVAFDAAGHGDVLVDGAAYATTDLGAHWARVQTTDRVMSMARESTSIWFVVGHCRFAGSVYCGTHLETTTVAATNVDNTRPLPSQGQVVRTGPSTAVLLVGTDDPASAGMAITTDSGASWQTVRLPCSELPDLQLAAASPSHWWLICEMDGGMNQGIVQLYQTTDAGAAWKLLSSANGNRATVGTLGDGINYSLTVSADDSRLWVTGIWGVRSSADGGRTWLYQANGMGDASFATVIPSSGTSAAVPIPGTGLWRTTDGLHWHH